MPWPVCRFRTLASAAAAALVIAIICASAYAASRHHVRHGKSAAVHATDDLGGRAPRPDIPGPIKFPDSQIEPLAWSDLDGWPQDNHALAYKTFRSGCRSVVGHSRSNNDDRPVLPALAEICRHALARPGLDEAAARSFFEDNFRPLRINKLGDNAGFITGYYEPIVEGSRFPTREFTVPVYRRPRDLVPPAGTAKGQGFPNTGKSMRRLPDGSLVPYYDRGDIENGVLDGRYLVICYLKDPIDLFFIQIQGSGRIRLEDGTMLRVNYDSHNGYPYTAIGRILAERGEVPRDQMSMDRIRQWMATAPDGGKELRSNNRSYVFFRVVGLSDDREASGAQGVPLTPGRSIAVDKALHVYGSPFFIEAQLPIDTPRSDTRFRRTMIAQDTGSAIVGPARADIYYGAGPEAGRIAGRFRNQGQFTLLLPRALDPVVAGAKFPLPLPRPAVEQVAGKDGGRVAEEEIPLPRPRPKVTQRSRSPA
jgi:membrane-bound lytic murein transglycosylase A